jgi:uncharacterized protein YdeI (YjbR/CyaY-like superfamily)
MTLTKNLNADSKTVHATTRAAWHCWLEVHSASESEIWLIFERGQKDQSALKYEDAVLEALCYGWIDSIIQRVDDRLYARKFTRRKDWQTWSESNRKRLRQLVQEGAQFLPGVLERIPPDVFDETIPDTPAPGKSLAETPDWLIEILQSNPNVWSTFQSLPPSHQRRYLGWILNARKLETQQRRTVEAVQMLEQGQTLNSK